MDQSVPEHLLKTRRREPVTMLEALSEGIFEEMVRDDQVFLMGEDIGAYGGAFKVTRGFLDHFGEQRVIDTPIAEGGFTGAAAGAAHMGLRPVVEIQFMDFISPAYDVITNYIATSLYRGAGPMPLVIRGPVGGGNRGGPFHSQNVEMAFFHTPGLKIVYPSTAYDAKGLIKSAIRDDNPVLFEEHKGLYRAPALREVLPDEDYVVPLGKARTVREGKDLTIVTYGAMVHKSVEAAETLSDEGVSVEVIDLRTLLPMDEEAIIDSVKRTGKLLVVHEDTRTGGIAGEIAMRVSEQAFEWLDGPMLRVTAIDAPVPYSGSLEDYFLPQTDDVLKAARYLAGY
ncbi:MAG: alpha-ketoacid dehydrogenase subunit beta [Gemmatimonadales bacterium]|jgi:2-oxoisovalerate dehydrogenase E1 component beta subunit|nr:alpha-ketoacid dehydrogenase subunit beta [Gemmatimonadales bacterium]MDG2238639.1 alpha-ketoacid dehydrogenase subunit beta [Longimicrobiales bacterium]MBT3498371.1 alpha-ketoacid dehydrogenase subunit beta [Gemmatimonadales bacterium]MBT3773926.1 alpha-ketoacid dehydrogenase subunit beta [Gemmatimonadales bacterium]MBT3956924.1 alpha-ketoacid dehydrogenase subunit beta [Gemmatimonadales bacterium]